MLTLSIRINPPIQIEPILHLRSPAQRKADPPPVGSSQKIEYPPPKYAVTYISVADHPTRHHATNPGCLLRLSRRPRNSPPCLYHSPRVMATSRMVTGLPLSFNIHSREPTCLGGYRLRSPNQPRSVKRNDTHCLVQPPRPPQTSSTIRSTISLPQPG